MDSGSVGLSGKQEGLKQDRNLHMTYFTGIDIGSTSAKTIVMDDKQNICLRMLQPTGWSCIDTAGEILRKLEAEGIKRENFQSEQAQSV